MPIRVFTFAEFAVWYKLSDYSARKLLRSGAVPALKTPSGWRIPDPGPTLVEMTRQQAALLAETPFIRGCEVADLMNVSERRVRRLAELGRLQCQMRGSRRVYSLASVEACMARRHTGGRSRSHSDIRPSVRAWAAESLAKLLKERGVAVPDFLRKARTQNDAETAP